MPAVLFLLAMLMTGSLGAATSGPSQAPSYSASSIVNSADSRVGALAPNTIGTVYGSGMAYITKALSAADIINNTLPLEIPGTGVHVSIGGIAASLYFVSPGQINFLIPSNLLAGPSTFQTVLDGHAGPIVPITISSYSPALFQFDPEVIAATHASGSAITKDDPAKPGEIVVIYGTGLGQTNPPLAMGEVPVKPLTLRAGTIVRVIVAGTALDSTRVLYSGVVPGFAGLYQVNVKLPDDTQANPEIQIAIGDPVSKPGVKLAVAP